MKYDIKNIITSFDITDDITLVTICRLPNNTTAVAKVFTCFAENDINIDMISLLASSASHQNVSFTARGKDLCLVLAAIGSLKETFTDIRTNVSSANCKITFAGKQVEKNSGVAAYIFEAFAKHEVDLLLVTTSETEISCLLDEAGTQLLKTVLAEEFDVSQC